MRIHYQCRLSLSRERLLSYTVTTTDVPVEFSQGDCFWILLFESSAHFGRLLFSESQRTFVLFFHAFQYLHGILLPLFRPRQYAVKYVLYFFACHTTSISHRIFGRIIRACTRMRTIQTGVLPILPRRTRAASARCSEYGRKTAANTYMS